MLESFRIRPMSESDITKVIENAGGCRAYEDSHIRTAPGADYFLDEAIIELKILDDQGLDKATRQRKLAALFRTQDSDRPVIVLDREALDDEGRRSYDSILQGPIKNAVSKARKQLRQTRTEFPEKTSTVLLVLNNGYTALNHDDLLKLVTHRVINDTKEIDGIVVGGCYYYSDGFDNYFLWPLEYIPVNLDHPFPSFEKLRKAWGEYGNEFMTSVVMGEIGPSGIKGPVIDVQFDLDCVTYVKPVTPMGEQSNFYVHGRPRKNSSNVTQCPPVAKTFPDLTRDEWRRCRDVMLDEHQLAPTFEQWQAKRREAASDGTSLLPFVPMHVSCSDWQTWCSASDHEEDMASLAFYANEIFTESVTALIAHARERRESSILPVRYVLQITEEIGQDCANDVSHIALMTERVGSDPHIQILVSNARIFHEHALALSCAYAVALKVEHVMWQKDQRYAWT